MTERLGFYLADCGRLMRKRFDVLAKRINVTGAQWRMLLYVERDPGVNQGQLADRLEVEPITACRMVDRLEQAGLVERRPDPNDRRAWLIYLTDAAKPLMVQLGAIGGDVHDQALIDFSDAERMQLIDLLRRLRANLLAEPDLPIEEARHG